MASIPQVDAGWGRGPALSPPGADEARSGDSRNVSVPSGRRFAGPPRPTWSALFASVIAVGILVAWVMHERATVHEVDHLTAARLSAAQQALIDRHYVEPANASAVHYYQLVLAADADNREARAGIDRIAERVLADAEALIPRDKLADAAVAIESIRRVRPDHPRLARVETLLRQQQERLVSRAERELQAAAASPPARTPTQVASPKPPQRATAPLATPQRVAAPVPPPAQTEQQRERERLLQLVLQRTQDNHLMEPLRDSATDHLQQLARLDRRSQAFQRGLDALGTRLVANARTAIYQYNFEHAAKLIAHARALGFNSPDLESADTTTRNALQNPSKPLTAAQLRRRIRYVEPEFPGAAKRLHESGWVDVNLTIAPNGSVTAARVTAASVPRVFDQAALAAVRKWRYEPRPSSGRKDVDILDVRVELTR